jgi:hypothetical protein
MGKIWAKFFQNALNKRVNSPNPTDLMTAKAAATKAAEPVAYRDQTSTAIFEAVKLADTDLLRQVLIAHEQSWPENNSSSGECLTSPLPSFQLASLAPHPLPHSLPSNYASLAPHQLPHSLPSNDASLATDQLPSRD